MRKRNSPRLGLAVFAVCRSRLRELLLRDVAGVVWRSLPRGRLILARRRRAFGTRRDSNWGRLTWKVTQQNQGVEKIEPPFSSILQLKRSFNRLIKLDTSDAMDEKVHLCQAKKGFYINLFFLMRAAVKYNAGPRHGNSELGVTWLRSAILYARVGVLAQPCCSAGIQQGSANGSVAEKHLRGDLAKAKTRLT